MELLLRDTVVTQLGNGQVGCAPASYWRLLLKSVKTPPPVYSEVLGPEPSKAADPPYPQVAPFRPQKHTEEFVVLS